MEENKKDTSGFLSGLVIGGVFGAAAIIALSSKEGQEKAKEFFGKVGGFLQEMEHILEDVRPLPAGRRKKPKSEGKIIEK